MLGVLPENSSRAETKSMAFLAQWLRVSWKFFPFSRMRIVAPSETLTVICPPEKMAVLSMVSEPSGLTRQAIVVLPVP